MVESEKEKEKEKKKVEGKKVRCLTCTSRRIANLLMRVDNTITLMKHVLTKT